MPATSVKPKKNFRIPSMLPMKNSSPKNFTITICPTSSNKPSHHRLAVQQPDDPQTDRITEYGHSRNP